MKHSSKVLFYGFLSSLVFIVLCIHFHVDNLLEKEEKKFAEISVKTSEETLKSKIIAPPAPNTTFNPTGEEGDLEPSVLRYKIEDKTIMIDGKLPILEDTDLLKQGIMNHCEASFKCKRDVVFVNGQSYPVWSGFAQKMIAFFHDHNLSRIEMDIDESHRVALTGELTDNAVKTKLTALIETEGVAYNVSDSTVVKVIEKSSESPVVSEPVVAKIIQTEKVETVVKTESQDPVSIAQEKISKLLEQETINFERNRARITKKSQEKLDEIIRIVKDIPDILIEVNGYTDASGKKAINKWISQERAKSVKNYLGSKGLNPQTIKAKGYGETNLLYPDKPYSTLNRRVEIVIKRR